MRIIIGSLNFPDVGRTLAGLDVFAAEPVSPVNPLINHPKVIAMPHVGGITEQSFMQIGRAVADNIESLRAGWPLNHQANQV